MPDFEPAERRRIGERRFAVLLNMSAQFALPDGFEERTYFVSFAESHEFDPAIAQIAHKTGDIEALGYLSDSITEADALNVSFIENLSRSDHALGRVIR